MEDCGDIDVFLGTLERDEGTFFALDLPFTMGVLTLGVCERIGGGGWKSESDPVFEESCAPLSERSLHFSSCVGGTMSNRDR